MSTTHKRLRGLWPLPGGRGQYPASLRAILVNVQDNPSPTELIDRVLVEFDGVRSRKAASGYIGVARTLGFTASSRSRVALTESGIDYLRSVDGGRHVLVTALRERVFGVEEILALLADEPLQINRIHAAVGSDWATQSQIRYRLQWMEDAGVIERRTGSAYPVYALV